ncbi:hypothetical protein PAAG_00925 [Paracoccidioides lutzii Pb01]|uniref:Uncharacterized protein n=1 Tax=Paracoccidioides lutzii (strain ATCC MYA-826 / Pb01) TaxID=502779 RepID=C1GQY0_PARBA|nr:hypothetical protein PAAG_00925 [Paracoccidioides lutzii Pb01]EEH38004.2 hypothetical protein PAAG_00925 [Paracoccidioides lutzii Pb01]
MAILLGRALLDMNGYFVRLTENACNMLVNFRNYPHPPSEPAFERNAVLCVAISLVSAGSNDSVMD